MTGSNRGWKGSARSRRLVIAAALLSCLGAAACGTTPERATAIGLARTSAQLADVPDSQLCNELVAPTTAVLAERAARGLGDCVQYRKDRESDERGYLDMIVATRGFGAPFLLFAVAKSREISSRECPYMDVRPFGKTTRDCPRYSAAPRRDDPAATRPGEVR